MIFNAVLMAGGRSRRMGREKADLEMRGLPLWQRQVEVLRQTGAREVFITGPEREDWRRAGCATVADAMPAVGPLSGLVAALRRGGEARLLVLAVDLPAMTAAYLRALVVESGARGGVGVVPCREGRFEPLAALYPGALLPLARECHAGGRPSLQGLVRQAVEAGLVVARGVTAAEEELFANVNTPGEYRAFLERI